MPVLCTVADRLAWLVVAVAPVWSGMRMLTPPPPPHLPQVHIPDIHIINMTGMKQSYQLSVRNVGGADLESVRVYDKHYWRVWLGVPGHNYSWWRLPTWQLLGGPIMATDACARYDGLCPIPAGAQASLSASHPGWLQGKYGMGAWGRYRSTFIFYTIFDERKPQLDRIGCVDIQYEYCISGERPSCKFENDGFISQYENDRFVSDGSIPGSQLRAGVGAAVSGAALVLAGAAFLVRRRRPVGRSGWRAPQQPVVVVADAKAAQQLSSAVGAMSA